MKKTAIIVGLLASQAATSEVPHTFNSGTPARASEVNQNFQSLDQRVHTLETEKVSQADLCSGDPSWAKRVASISHSPKDATIGQDIVVGDHTYKIVKFPIVEFGTDEVYSISFPARVIEKTADPGSVADLYIVYWTERVDASVGQGCNQFAIDGFPAFSYGEDVTRSYHISLKRDNYPEEPVERNLTVVPSVQYFVVAKIGQTLVKVRYDLGDQGTTTTHPINHYDFTSPLDVSQFADLNGMITTLDNLLDYVSISKVQ